MEKSFGQRLDELMKNAGYNKNSLSREAGVHPTTLKNWIENKTTPDDLKLDIIARLLHTSKGYLYSGIGDKHSIKEKVIKKDNDFETQTIDNKLNMIFNQNKNILDKFDKIIDEIEVIKDTLYEENSLFAANFERIAANLHVDLSDENQKVIDRTKESLN